MGEVAGPGAWPTVLVIVGPTASGKTALALSVAEDLNGEIVSADARQVYRRLDIGTAKPSPEDRSRVPHHFIDMLDPREGYTSGRFAKEAIPVLEDIVRRGRTPIVAGGSGLYVKAVIDGIFEGPEASPEIRKRWDDVWKRSGEAGLRDALRAVDPDCERSIERGKPRRLVRALEVHELTGLTMTEHRRRQQRDASFRFVQIGLAPAREQLYRRIDLRSAEMIEAGLVQEVQALRRDGYDRSLNSLNTVGYREVFDFLDGGMSAERMLTLIQTHTRQYAKRQLTWFRADDRIIWLEGAGVRPVELLAERVGDILGPQKGV